MIRLRAWRREVGLGYPGGPNVIARETGGEGQRDAERSYAADFEGGGSSHERGTQERQVLPQGGKARNRLSPWSLQKETALPHLGFSL